MLAIADRARADHWTNEALRIVTTSADPRTRRWAGSLHNNAGWARHDAGDYAAALAEFEAAQSAYEVHGTAEQVRVARWAVARALRSLARFDEAMAIQLQLAEQGPADGYVRGGTGRAVPGDRPAGARRGSTPPPPSNCSVPTAGSPSTSRAAGSGCGGSPSWADARAGPGPTGHHHQSSRTTGAG